MSETNYQPLQKTVKIFDKDPELLRIFAFNEFSEDVEYLKAPIWDSSVIVGKNLDDQDITQLRYYFSKVHGYEPPKYVMGEACFIVSKRNNYHPIKQFIESVEWDGIGRCDEWLIKATGCDDNYYTRMAGAKFLIAAVNRVYNPGCKFDHMMILEGPQGIYKSTLVETIAGNWYLDTNFNNHDKDLIDSMRSAFIIEISELSGMNKKDIDWLKSFLSKKVDRVRLPYASRSKDFKRKCVFMGTYNPSGNNMYLRDDTGNRRFWPIECSRMIDVAYVLDNRAQLWAEALVRFRNNERYYIDNKHALDILYGLHEDRELESPTHRKIKYWLGVRDEVCMDDIIEDCLKINIDGKKPKDMLSVSTTIGIIMKKLGWSKGINDKRDRYYAPNGSVESKEGSDELFE